MRAVPPIPDAPGAEHSAAHAADDAAVSVDVMPASPPDDVLAAIDAAGQVADRLEAAGQHVSFGSDPATGALQIQLQDEDGNVLSRLSPSEVLALIDDHAEQ